MEAAGAVAFAGEASVEATALEVGRLLFARPWRFVTACPTMAALPPAAGVEVAFAGRSNVGKSSLINAVTGRKALAKSSNTPGRTRQLNFFASNGDLFIVDMPGYGYAKAPKKEVAAWTRLVFAYLRGRANLRRVYLLVDARHGLKPIDVEAMAALDEAAVSYQVVLTKADKLIASERGRRCAEVAAAIGKRPAAHPEVLATSASDLSGIAELRAAIARLADETG